MTAFRFNRITKPAWLLLAAFLFATPSFQESTAEDRGWTLKIRERIKPKSGGEFSPRESAVAWKPESTAMVIVDMWDDHHCVSAAKRVVEMAPHMNRVVKAARNRGVLIIHAPSDCADFYRASPQRKTIEAAPEAKAAVKFRWNHFNPEREGPLAGHLEKGGCSCDTPEPCSPSKIVWTRQIESIEIDDGDAVSSDGQEIHNLLEQRGIENVIIMGVHTNRCVLGRPFGIRQMVYLGRNVVLCRDLTDSYHRDPGRHFEGLNRIIAHVEKYWCPTITSESITGEPAFRFAADETGKSAGAGRHPDWKYVLEGTPVELLGRTWNTRKAKAVEDTGDYAIVGQRNGTATLLGDSCANRGRVEWEAFYENGVLEAGGGGKHFHEVMSYVSDRAGRYRENIRSGWVTRIEIASLADRPRCIVWNYGPEFDGQAATILKLGEPPEAEQWIRWALEWIYEPETGKLEFEVSRDGKRYRGEANLRPGSEGPGRFFLHGHVETRSGMGRVRFRNFRTASD